MKMKDVAPGDIIVTRSYNWWDNDIAKVIAVDVEHPANKSTKAFYSRKNGRWITIETYDSRDGQFHPGQGWADAVLPAKILRKIDSVEAEMSRRLASREEKRVSDQKLAKERAASDHRLGCVVEQLRRLGLVSADRCGDNVQLSVSDCGVLFRRFDPYWDNSVLEPRHPPARDNQE